MRIALPAVLPTVPRRSNREFGKRQIVFLLLIVLIGCERATPQTRRSVKRPTVASLVPAATDLLLGMGAGDHLVAVSHYEAPRAELSDLPKVGDYESTDWEKLAGLRPDVMLIFMTPAQTPPGLLQRAASLHIRVVNLKTDTLAEIFAAIEQLGVIVREPESAAKLSEDLHQQLEAVRARQANQPRVKTLLSLSDERFDLVGKGTYLDELLTIAGGDNALPDSQTAYPTVDRERIVELVPRVVIQLCPSASADWKVRAGRLWRSMPQEPRVMTIDDPFVLQPGAHIGEIAEKMGAELHPR